MSTSQPNILLIMCDDLGYGDTGFNGNEIIRTPYLDHLRTEGGHFTRFYAGGPVCSPTRGTCLTGRHYQRYGITHANKGCLPVQEINLANVCHASGYRTGHFGKWHLGTLTTAVNEGNRGGPAHSNEYAPPWDRGFDICFSTEAKVPTWDPMITPAEVRPNGKWMWGEPGSPFGMHYWNEHGEQITDNLSGDDSRVIVDRAESFIRECAKTQTAFFAVVWFHTPHAPVVAGSDYRAMYEEYDEGEQHYYGCITAMDEQIGRLNNLVKELGLEGETVIWFCSDNGPEGGLDQSKNGRNRGVTGGLRGRKRSLFNGGVGVPALVKWPGVVKPGATYEAPCSTLDYLPTMSSRLGFVMPDGRPIDGVNLLPLLQGETTDRPNPIPYRFFEKRKAMYGSPTISLMDNRYKFMTNFSEEGDEELLFDLWEDPGESRNLIVDYSKQAGEMRDQLREFVASCRRSHFGADYPEHFKPVEEYQEVTGHWA